MSKIQIIVVGLLCVSMQAVVAQGDYEGDNIGLVSQDSSTNELSENSASMSHGAKNQTSVVLEVQRLFLDKNFDKLNYILERYQDGADIDVQAEEKLFAAYYAFRLNNSTHESFFNEWVDASPKSYQAYLARASFYYRMGWKARGSKWASETKKEQFEEMGAYFDRALKDIAMSLEINDSTMVAYNLIIGITNALGKRDEMDAVVKQALKINPASYKIRAHYLGAITPRWGGSFEEMQAFIADSLVYVYKNPKLKLLEGFPYAEAAKMQASLKKFSVAEEFYTKALTYGENHKILKERGKNSYRREKYKEALVDLDRAIALYSEDADYYYWRSKIYSKLHKNVRASDDIVQAGQLDPDDEDIQRQRKWLVSKFVKLGYKLKKNQEPAAAVGQYNYAIRLSPDDAYTYYRRAHAYVDLNQHDSALEDLKFAIELDPNDINYYVLLDWILAAREDWEQIIHYWDRYIDLLASKENSACFYRQMCRAQP